MNQESLTEAYDAEQQMKHMLVETTARLSKELIQNVDSVVSKDDRKQSTDMQRFCSEFISKLVSSEIGLVSFRGSNELKALARKAMDEQLEAIEGMIAASSYLDSLVSAVSFDIINGKESELDRIAKINDVANTFFGFSEKMLDMNTKLTAQRKETDVNFIEIKKTLNDVVALSINLKNSICELVIVVEKYYPTVRKDAVYSFWERGKSYCPAVWEEKNKSYLGKIKSFFSLKGLYDMLSGGVSIVKQIAKVLYQHSTLVYFLYLVASGAFISGVANVSMFYQFIYIISKSFCFAIADPVIFGQCIKTVVEWILNTIPATVILSRKTNALFASLFGNGLSCFGPYLLGETINSYIRLCVTFVCKATAYYSAAVGQIGVVAVNAYMKEQVCVDGVCSQAFDASPDGVRQMLALWFDSLDATQRLEFCNDVAGGFGVKYIAMFIEQGTAATVSGMMYDGVYAARDGIVAGATMAKNVAVDSASKYIVEPLSNAAQYFFGQSKFTETVGDTVTEINLTKEAIAPIVEVAKEEYVQVVTNPSYFDSYFNEVYERIRGIYGYAAHMLTDIYSRWAETISIVRNIFTFTVSEYNDLRDYFGFAANDKLKEKLKELRTKFNGFIKLGNDIRNKTKTIEKYKYEQLNNEVLKYKEENLTLKTQLADTQFRLEKANEKIEMLENGITTGQPKTTNDLKTSTRLKNK